MTRLIVASTPIFGHIEPMRVVAADLVRRGHSVTFLTGTTYEDAVERTGSTFVPLLGNADLTPERLARAQSEQAAIAPARRGSNTACARRSSTRCPSNSPHCNGFLRSI